MAAKKPCKHGRRRNGRCPSGGAKRSGGKRHAVRHYSVPKKIMREANSACKGQAISDQARASCGGMSKKARGKCLRSAASKKRWSCIRSYIMQRPGL